MYNLELEVEKILNADERILCFYSAEKTNSSYFSIMKDEDKYISFRVSGHSTNSYYANRTFDCNEDLDRLLEEIRNYLDKSDWYILKYEDYFTLKAIYKAQYKRIQFCIDNSMGFFDSSIGGLIFYQSRRFGRHNKEFNVVSESLQKELRKLFASGLISSYRQGYQDILVYINKSGRLMMEYMDEKYKERFDLDEKNISYKYIEVPEID